MINVAPSAAQATAGLSAPVSPAAATISGEGVSPAAMAAARGSPPGNAAATAFADAGRLAGSGSRQRRMARSVAGSIPATWLERLFGRRVSRCICSISAALPASKARRPVNSS